MTATLKTPASAWARALAKERKFASILASMALVTAA